MKKISLIILCSVLACLLITATVLGIVENSYKADFADADAIVYRITDGSLGGSTYKNDEAFTNYKSVVEKINDTFKESYLTGIFTGRIGYNSRFIQTSKSPVKNFSGSYIELNYFEDQLLTLDGKPYYYGSNSTTKIYYSDIYILLPDDNTLQDEMAKSHIFYYDETNDVYYKQYLYANFYGLDSYMGAELAKQ